MFVVPGVMSTPSTLAITLAFVPTFVIVQVSAIWTVKVWASVASRAVAVKPGCVEAMPSYTFVLSIAVNVTALQVITCFRSYVTS